jgi:hypothetical protein
MPTGFRQSRASQTSMAMNASPATKPLTPRLAVPPLPKGEGEKSKSQPSPRGEGARRRRAGEGFLSTPLNFDGALIRRCEDLPKRDLRVYTLQKGSSFHPGVTFPMMPLRLARSDHFSAVREFLDQAGYSEQAVSKRLGLRITV